MKKRKVSAGAWRRPFLSFRENHLSRSPGGNGGASRDLDLLGARQAAFHLLVDSVVLAGRGGTTGAFVSRHGVLLRKRSFFQTLSPSGENPLSHFYFGFSNSVTFPPVKSASSFTTVHSVSVR